MSVFETACALLDTLKAAFADDPFGRAYVSDGSANWELNEALIVEFDGREPTPFGATPNSSPADMSSGAMALRTMFTIHTLRWSLWSTSDEAGNGPDPSQLQDHARRLLCDADRVIDALLKAMGSTALFGPCGRMEFVSQAAVVPEGGLVGCQTKVFVS